MTLAERIIQLRGDIQLTPDHYLNRLNGLSPEATTELLDLLRSCERVLGVRASLRRIVSSPERQFVLLVNSTNLLTLPLPSNVILCITSMNPVSLSISLGREELVSGASWSL